MVKHALKRTLVVLAMFSLGTAARAQTSKYITNHRILASLLGEHYGIPSAVLLAVATVESAGGNCPTAKVLNNHFGIVGKNKYVNHRGHSSRYKQYDNVYASYIDFCNMISRKKFYTRLKNNDNPQVWIKAMSHSGYSENPEDWERKINTVLATNKL